MTYNGNAYRLYNCFRNDLREARDPAMVYAAVERLFPALKAKAVAVTVQTSNTCRQTMTTVAQIGSPALWKAYLALSQSNTEPMARILRLSPHPVAVSDILRHPRLGRRSHRLSQLLADHDMNDALAVPLFDQQFKFCTIIFAGRDLTLRPTNRHLMTQVASDVVEHLATFPPREESQAQPPHLKLTARQMEIATWLIAGKTDWEIGEILAISPKTVNFHVENIKRTYGVRSRNQFVAAIVHDGGLEPA